MFREYPNIKMAEVKNHTLVNVLLRESSDYEANVKNIKYQSIELMFTDGFRVGVTFHENTSKIDVADELRKMARSIEESRY